MTPPFMAEAVRAQCSVHAQSTLQITAKRLQGCPSCGVQCALHSKSVSCHSGVKGYFLGETRLPRAPRTEEEHQGVAIRVNCFDVQLGCAEMV